LHGQVTILYYIIDVRAGKSRRVNMALNSEEMREAIAAKEE